MRPRRLRRAISGFILLGTLLSLGVGSVPGGTQAAAPASTEVQAASPVSAGPTLLEVDTQHAVVEWSAPSYQVSERVLERRTVDEVFVPDCPPAGRVGDPQLPVCTVLLGVPPDASLSLRIVEEETIPVPGNFYLPPIPDEVVEEELPLEAPFALRPVGKTWAEGPAYARDDLFPRLPARLGEPAFLRHQRIVSLSFYPLQYRPQSGELLYHPRLRVEVSFADAREVMGQVAEPADFERFLSRELLNYPQARSWRRITQQPLDLPPVPPDPGFRIPVDQTGVYRLTYDRLQAAGLPVSTLDPRTLRLFRYGAEVAIRVSGEEDGSFDPGDSVLFYGQALTHNRYTDTEMYWLTYGGPSGQRMLWREGAPGGTAPVPFSFAVEEHLEENQGYYSYLPWRPDHDHWWWNYTYPEGGLFEQVYTFPAHPLAEEDYTATLRLHLHSFTQDGKVNPDHHIRVLFNGVLLDELWWDGRVELTPTFAFPSDLYSTTNSVRIQAPGDTGAFAHMTVYDWLELGQRRRFVAEEDQLAWAGTAGNWEYHLTDFSEPEILLLDISGPDAPVEIVSATVIPDGLSYVLHFEDTVAQTTRYLAVAGGQWLEPAVIEEVVPTDLRDPANGADYIVVTHGDFYTQALSLAAFRAGQGLRAMAVDVEDVYDVFAYGRQVSEAIRDFLAYAYESWTSPAPTYVVLLGDGHFDPKDYRGFGMGNFMPPYLALVDPWNGETAADNRYVCLSGEDALPDMHLGRLPANTAGEALIMVNKIVNYESAPPPGVWRRQALFVADNPDQAGDFAAISDALIACCYPPPYEAERVYLGITHPYEWPSIIARNAIITATNEGRFLVNYIGHAGPTTWANEQLLDNPDLVDLFNDPYYPVVLPMTCYVGYYHFPYPIPDAYAMAEEFLRTEGKGWIASWAPTGKGVATGHDYLDKGFFRAVFFDDERRLGPATLAGKLNLYQAGAWLDLLDTYLLFGDPALSMPLLKTDLSLQKEVQPTTPLFPGDPLTFTLSLANAGPATAHHIVLTDILPAAIVSPTVTAEGVVISPRPGPAFSWDVSDLAAGEAGTVTIAAYISSTARPGLLSNQARVATSAKETDLQNNVDWVTLAITVGPPAMISLTADPAVLPADGASLSLITALVLDEAGNPVADGTSVFFATDAGTFFDGGSTHEGQTVLGRAEVFLRAADQVLTATVSVTSGLAWNQILVPFVPMEPYSVIVWAKPTVISLTGTAQITATVEDVMGHPVADGTPVTLSTSLGTLTPTLAATAAGLVTATLQGDGRHGLATIVARSGAVAGATAVQIGAGADVTLTLEATPTQIPADGQSQATVSATLRGPDGQLVTGTYWVSFSTTLGEIPSRSLTLSGTAVVSLTAGTRPGLALITAESEGTSAWTEVRLVPGGPGSLTLTATPQEIPVGGRDALLLAIVLDDWGHPVADGTLVSFDTNLGTVTPTVVATRGGRAQALLTSGTQSGVALVSAQAGLAGDTVAVVFLPLSPAMITLSADPETLPADGVSTATLSVWVGDQFGNPVADGSLVRLATSLGQVFPEEVGTVQGWATATLRAGTQLGTATVTAMTGGIQAQVWVPFVPGPPATVLVLAEPARLFANGVSTATVRAYIGDGHGHAVADDTLVTLSTSLGTITPELVLTRNGWVTATLRSEATTGWATLRAESGSAWGTTQVEFFMYRSYLALALRGAH